MTVRSPAICPISTPADPHQLMPNHMRASDTIALALSSDQPFVDDPPIERVKRAK